MNILETASGELSHIPRTVHVSLERVPNLPLAEHVNCLDMVYTKGCNADKYWISWTDELGAWVNSDGSNVVLVVSESSQDTDIS